MKNLDDMFIDEIIEYRDSIRVAKDWHTSDIIRDYLDSKLVFVFDTKDGSDVYYLTDNYFDKIDSNVSKRKYLENRLRSEIQAEKNFDAWLYTNLNRNRT